MQFIKSSLWAGLAIGFKAVGSIVINKAIAAYYQDPKVFALLAHFQNLLGIFISVPSDGVNQGVVKYLSDKEISNEDYDKIFSAGFWLNFLIFILSIPAIFLFKDYLLGLFVQGIGGKIWLFGLIIVLLIQLANLFLLSVLLATHHLRTYVLINILGTFTSLLLVLYCVYNCNFSIVLLSIGLGASLLFVVNLWIVNRKRLIKISLPDIVGFKKLGQFILMALSIMLFDRAIDFFVRQYAMNEFGTYQTGLWQSVVKFSDYYTSAFTAVIGMVYYPRISQLINNSSELKKYVVSVLKVAIPVVIAGLLTVYFFREFILELFFNKQFKAASFLFDFQLLGDFFRLCSLLLSFLILAQAHTVLFISSQAISALLYIILILLCTDQWGMEGFPMAHMIRFVLYLFFVSVLYRKLIF